jgi:hypothetical protein
LENAGNNNNNNNNNNKYSGIVWPSGISSSDMKVWVRLRQAFLLRRSVK